MSKFIVKGDLKKLYKKINKKKIQYYIIEGKGIPCLTKTEKATLNMLIMLLISKKQKKNSSSYRSTVFIVGKKKIKISYIAIRYK